MSDGQQLALGLPAGKAGLPVRAAEEGAKKQAPRAQDSPVGAVQAPLVESDETALDPPLDDKIKHGTRLELVGRELYITASFLNHSCAPNCCVERGAGVASISALHDVQVCLTSH